MVSHRGASGYAPEATLAAYRLAREMGADAWELDVRMSRDREIVALHDSSVNRTTDGKGKVGKLTLAELKKLDAGSWFNRSFPAKARPDFVGQRIPTLQDIIDLAREGTSGLYIELKDPGSSSGLESVVISIVRRNHFEGRVSLISFDAASLEEVKTLDPAIRTALVTNNASNDPVRAALAVNADELAIRHQSLTERLADESRRAGLSLTVWTVDQERDMKQALALGVDTIITNYPDRLIRLLAK